ncbi:MAG: hypothetical protein HRU17_02640 [Polyangiaceae bacterium]|nr:hypothetical protein [Polyangiaceae bacterium]
MLDTPAKRVGASALALSIAISTILGFLPLLDGPGYEATLAMGLFLPTLSALTAAQLTVIWRHDPLPALANGAWFGVILAAAAYLVFVGHGFRTGLCDLWEGTSDFVLGPLFGCAMGGVWGALVALVFRPSRHFLRPLFSLIAPLLMIGISLWRFYTSPMVFAFDPFFGFFAGPIYDTVVDGHARMTTYRVGSSATLLCLACSASLFRRRPDGSVYFNLELPPATVAMAILGLCASAYVTWSGPKLGHYQTDESIAQTLGHRADGQRCRVLYGDGVSKTYAHALARECDAHVRQLEAYLEHAGPPKIRVYLFDGPAEKGRLTGASKTYIAKPWLNAIYIQQAGFPHPVLGHELAHVVAGAFGQGPFRIAGTAGGYIPDPGRIEGLAVAAAPSLDADLSPAVWAAAMLKLELLPPLDSVFRLGFFQHNSSRAYQVAGAFVHWFREKWGSDALAEWYGGGPFFSVTDGISMATLEKQWKAELAKQPLSPQALAVAKARFDRPGIVGRRCPHVVDRLSGAGFRALSVQAIESAQKSFGDLLELDAGHLSARLALAECDRRKHEETDAKKRYQAIADDESLSVVHRSIARERLGDLALEAGDGNEALLHYQARYKALVSEGHKRALDVKMYASNHSAARTAIVALLIGDASLGRDWAVSAAELRAWSELEPKLGIADYLLGKNWFAQGRWTLAATHLDRALARKLPIASVNVEARRTRIFVGCALGERTIVPAMTRALVNQKQLSVSRRDGLLRLAERCLDEGPTTPTKAPPELASGSAAASGSAEPSGAPGLAPALSVSTP